MQIICSREISGRGVCCICLVTVRGRAELLITLAKTMVSTGSWLLLTARCRQLTLTLYRGPPAPETVPPIWSARDWFDCCGQYPTSHVATYIVPANRKIGLDSVRQRQYQRGSSPLQFRFSLSRAPFEFSGVRRGFGVSLPTEN